MFDAAVSFDPETHTYTIQGKPVPGVTRVLRALLRFGGASPEVIAAACEMGTKVHQVVELEEEGTLDEDELDPILEPSLLQYRRFKAATGFRCTHSEQLVYSTRYGFAGCLDLSGIFPAAPADEIALIDVKTGSSLPPTVGPQTAGYDIAARESLRIPSHIRTKRYSLHLRPDFYTLTPLAGGLSDQTTFLSGLNILRWCNDKRISGF